MISLPPVDAMQRAYQSSDPAYEGLFLLGVKSTGIFCRPTCSARKPLPQNVEYFSTVAQCVSAGYRPCKRCKPLEPDARPDWVVKLLERIEADPATRLTDAEVNQFGVDPGTARRYFQKHFGMTFQAYARSRRLGGALAHIREGGAIDDAVFDTGFDSHSGFREAFAKLFGQTPGRARGQECVTLHWVRSPLGPLVAGATSEGICLLEFSDRRRLEKQMESVRRAFRLPLVPGKTDVLKQLETELAAYFAGTLQRFTVPLVYPGTPFQQKVWQELLRIPYGQTRSYADMADAVGSPGAQRAVGTANGMNRIAIVIPCHRVVNKGGKLGGYGGGLHRKQFLLDLEGGFLKKLEARS